MALVEKFVADTASWDKSLKNAVAELNRVTAEVQKQSKSFKDASKEDVEFARALGQLQTKSKDVRGQMNELTTALTNMKTRFNQLSAVEKQSQFGKTLQGSIVQVEARIKDLGAAMPQTTSSLGSLRSAVDALGGVSLLKMASAAGAASLTLEGFKKVMTSTDSAADAYGRTVAMATSIQRGFWTSVTMGSLDSFIKNLKDVARLAKEAYNAMDALATFDASDMRQQSEFNLRRSQLRANIRSGVDVEASKKALKELEQEEAAYYKRSASVRKAAAYAQLKDLTRAKNGQWVAPYAAMGADGKEAAKRDAAKLKAQFATTSVVPVYDPLSKTTRNEERTTWKREDIKDRYEALINLSELDDPVLKGVQDAFAGANNAAQQYFDRLASDSRLMRAGEGGSSRQEFRAERIESKNISSSLGTTESQADLEALMAHWRSRLHEATTGVAYTEAENMIATIQERMNVLPLAIRLGVSTESALEMKTKIDEEIASWEFEPIPIRFDVEGNPMNEIGKTAEGTKKQLQGVSNAFTAMGSAMQSIDDPSAKVAGLVFSAIGNTAAAFGTAQAQAAAMGPWAWIAFAATGLATMITTIMGIKNATAGSYAQGGIVPGNSFSGDAMTANVNSGELILSRAGQDSIAAQLTSSPMAEGINLSWELKGDRLIAVIGNTLKGSGIKGFSLFG